jgi:FtsP/CotA-like multicopper oxidase with cupredoxin domain
MQKEKKIMETKISKIVGLSLVLLAVMALLTQTPVLAQPLSPPGDQTVVAARPPAATVAVDLCVSAGSVTMPDNTPVPIWGFSVFGGSSCLPAQLPGPVLRVAQGDTVVVTLYNTLNVATSIIFPGQIGVEASGSGGLFTAEAPPCSGGCSVPADYGTATYTFIAGQPGTYLYESGTAAQPQVAMGLYGALIVDSATPGQAYSDASTAYDVEEVLVLSEIDPALNANPGGFNLLDYNPTYWLLNGRAYGGPAGSNANPDVLDPDDASAQPYSAAISASAGERVLVRYINAGGTHDTMTLLGQHQRLIARNADELTGGQAYDATAETIPSGHTADAIMVFDAAGSYPLYNRQLHLTNGDLGPNHLASDGGGGMMTFVNVQAVLNFNDFTITSFGNNQDASPTVSIEDGGETLRIVGNGWKKIDFPYTVTPDTVLEFDFQSSVQGEIHGIGLDENNLEQDTVRTFQLYGTQTFGIQAFNNYAGDAPNLKHYKIRVGQYYTGNMLYLTFTNDHDILSPNAESVFSNIQVYEEPPPTLIVNGNNYVVEPYGNNQDAAPAVSIEDGGATLRIVGNGWKRISFPYTVLPNTVLEFDFQSSVEGEIHGIGLDENNAEQDAVRTFQLHGTQVFGNQAFNDYAGETPKHYVIPVGTYYTGSMIYLTFTNDHDVPSPTAESVFSNISVHE